MYLILLTSSSLQIFVQPQKGNRFELAELPTTTTCSKIKQMISERLNIPNALIRLIYRESFEIPDDMTLSDLGAGNLAEFIAKIDYYMTFIIGKRQITQIIPRESNVKSLLSVIKKNNPWIDETEGGLELYMLGKPPITSFDLLSKIIDEKDDPIGRSYPVPILLTKFSIIFKFDDGEEIKEFVENGYTESISKYSLKHLVLKDKLLCLEKNCLTGITNPESLPYMLGITSKTIIYVKDADPNIYLLSGDLGMFNISNLHKGATLENIETFIKSKIFRLTNTIKFTLNKIEYSNDLDLYRGIRVDSSINRRIEYQLKCIVQVIKIPNIYKLEREYKCDEQLILVHREIGEKVNDPFYVLTSKEKLMDLYESIGKNAFTYASSDTLLLEFRTDKHQLISLYIHAGDKQLIMPIYFDQTQWWEIRNSFLNFMKFKKERFNEVDARIQISPTNIIEAKGLPYDTKLSKIVDAELDRGAHFGTLHIFFSLQLPLLFSYPPSGTPFPHLVDFFSPFSSLSLVLSPLLVPLLSARELLYLSEGGEPCLSLPYADSSSPSSLSLGTSSVVHLRGGMPLTFSLIFGKDGYAQTQLWTVEKECGLNTLQALVQRWARVPCTVQNVQVRGKNLTGSAEHHWSWEKIGVREGEIVSVWVKIK